MQRLGLLAGIGLATLGTLGIAGSGILWNFQGRTLGLSSTITSLVLIAISLVLLRPLPNEPFDLELIDISHHSTIHDHTEAPAGLTDRHHSGWDRHLRPGRLGHPLELSGSGIRAEWHPHLRGCPAAKHPFSLADRLPSTESADHHSAQKQTSTC